MLYNPFPNALSVTTCAFPIPTDIIEDVPLRTGHSADTAAVIATRVPLLEVVKGHVYIVRLGLLYIRVSQMKIPQKRRCKIDTPLCAAGGTDGKSSTQAGSMYSV